MKRILAILLALSMLLCMAACGKTEAEPGADAAWDELETQGKIQTENGVQFVTVTIPADFIGDGVTQESLDGNAGKAYISAAKNEDGSVTYKLTKQQHKVMLDEYVKQIEDALQEIAEDPDYNFKGIAYSEDFSEFNVYLSTEELGLSESFMVLAFYMYGGMYAVFAGRSLGDITVHYYNVSGKLVSTSHSSEIYG